MGFLLPLCGTLGAQQSCLLLSGLSHSQSSGSMDKILANPPAFDENVATLPWALDNLGAAFLLRSLSSFLSL